MKEEKFEKVVTNEYKIDLALDIILPILGIVFSFLAGIFWGEIIGIIFFYLAIFDLIIFLMGLVVWIHGRKVYWRKIK